VRHHERRERIADSLLLVLTKLAIGALVLHQGFSHVSDDDYARTVIAEQFAHTPALDPSGTSWMPLPFWLTGGAMIVAGRNLDVARAAAIVLGAGVVAAPYIAMRVAGMARHSALAATALAMALPYSAWLGVSTVPEGWFGALVGAAAIAARVDRARPWAAGALLAASLSRYEAWPACGVAALLCTWTAVRRDRLSWRRELVWALVAVAGPLAWMAWNAHAHGSAFHFVARVTTFRRAIGAASVPLADKVLGYPRALAEETPEVAVLGSIGLVGLAVGPLRDRWRWAAATVLLVLGFLVWGDVHDGAPTHHPARALAPVWWILVAMGADALDLLWRRFGSTPRPRAAGVSRRALYVGAVAAAAGIAWCASLPTRWARSPGRSDAERRDSQIARGLDMRARDVQAADITPCAFEHFALLAAWAEPERATLRPRTGEPMSPTCPHVLER
jgi:hypothetical protein